MRFLSPPPFLVALFLSAAPCAAQNDKQVLGDDVFTPGELAEGAFVTYLIRFQNNGEDTVNQLLIRDTLDPRIDPNSFEMIASSHTPELLRDEGSNLVRWLFEDLALAPASVNPPASYGFVLFRVRLQPFLAPGQTITNRACFWFDQQTPLCTNEAVVWIDADSATDDPWGAPEQTLRIAPNPNDGHFRIATADGEDAHCWITDACGRTVWRNENLSFDDDVSLGGAAPGLYVLWVRQGDGGLFAERFSVVR